MKKILPLIFILSLNMLYFPTQARASVLTGDFIEPAGCKRPVDDYSPVQIAGYKINSRTYQMLEYASELTGDKIHFLEKITQGSYSNNGPISFGTHLGGGAVDLSVFKGSSIMRNDIEVMIIALRVAGFAAWYRAPGDLGPNSDPHIHAVAIGDQELSESALEQINGDDGYFSGKSGIPDNPYIDRHGGPVICRWMVDDGLVDPIYLQQTIFTPTLPVTEVIKNAAERYITQSEEETYQAAYAMNFVGGKAESPVTMCGPLSWSILHDAGLLPAGQFSSANTAKSFWLASPRYNGRPWSLFTDQDHTIYQFKTPINQFDFSQFPLYSGDFLYTYARPGHDYEHMVIVSEVTSDGKVYAVSNEMQKDQTWLITKVLLYDIQNPDIGAFKVDWVTDGKVKGKTGLGGFEVFRFDWIGLPPGSLYDYSVQTGDTVYRLAEKFHTTPGAIIRANPTVRYHSLPVNKRIQIPVNTDVLRRSKEQAIDNLLYKRFWLIRHAGGFTPYLP
jgi:hypothetical protein